MIPVDDKMLPGVKDLPDMAKDKFRYKTTIKDKEGKKWEILQFFPFHILTEGEFGFKRCFTYQEALWEMA